MVGPNEKFKLTGTLPEKNTPRFAIVPANPGGSTIPTLFDFDDFLI